MDTSNVQPGNGSTSGIQRKKPVGLAVEHAPARLEAPHAAYRF